MQRTDAGIAAPGKRQFSRAAHPDHLVVDQVGGHSDQVQVAPTLTDHFVPGGKWDQMRKAFQRDARAIGDKTLDRLAHRQVQRPAHSTTVRDCSRRYCAR